MKRSLSIALLALASATAWFAPVSAKQGASFALLYERAPVKADGFVAVDHVRLSEHPASSKLRAFVHEQGGARGLQALTRLGVASGKEIVRSLSFNIGYDDADIVTGPMDFSALKERAASRLKAKFKEGEIQGLTWFSVSADRRLVVLSEVMALVAKASMLEKVIDRAKGGQGKALSTKRDFKKLLAPAKKAKAAIWGAGWTSKRLKRLSKGKVPEAMRTISMTRFHASGRSNVTLVGALYTDKKESAEALKSLLEAELSTRFNSLTMKMLGVSALAKGITLKVKGKALNATLELTPAQVDLVTTSGGKVISILRAKGTR